MNNIKINWKIVIELQLTGIYIDVSFYIYNEKKIKDMYGHIYIIWNTSYDRLLRRYNYFFVIKSYVLKLFIVSHQSYGTVGIEGIRGS